MPEGKSPNGQKSGLAERYLSRVPDEQVLALDAYGIDGDQSGHVDEVFRNVQRQKKDG